jgi:hypothetical protein
MSLSLLIYNLKPVLNVLFIRTEQEVEKKCCAKLGMAQGTELQLLSFKKAKITNEYIHQN